MRKYLRWIISLLIFVSLPALSMTLSSPAFSSGGVIPTPYTCHGINISPPLVWKDVPSQAKSLVLTVSDPDAPSGVWAHWLVINLPVTIHGLAAGATLPVGAQALSNSWKNARYDGPCPPARKLHRYEFQLFALDTMLNLPASANALQLGSAMRGHVVDKAIWMGRYASP